MENKFLVLSSSSLGYSLYNFDNGKEIISKPRNKMFYIDNTPISIGDYVSIDDDNNIIKILPRINKLQRPNVSNIDIALTIISAKEPDFSSFLLDKYLTINNAYHIKSVIVISKVDLLKNSELKKLKTRMSYYEKIGYNVIYLDNYNKDESFYKLIDLIKDKIVCLIGQTGVGKSSFLNLLDDNLKRKVDANSKIYGRGRHTTKEIKIFKTDYCFIFDTPGFSSLDIDFLKPIDIAHHFPGYESFFSNCKYNDCLHDNVKLDCQILKKVSEDFLSSDSYQNYVKILQEVKSFDVWKKKI